MMSSVEPCAIARGNSNGCGHSAMAALPLRTKGGRTTRAAIRLAADLDFAAVAGLRRHAGQADRTLERRRKRATRDLAFAHAGNDDFLVRTQHGALFDQQADEFARGAAGLLRSQGAAADEIAILRFPGDRPAEPRFQRRRGFVHVVAVQIHARFEAQRVARAEPAGSDTRLAQPRPRGRRPRAAGSMISQPSSPV